MFVTTNETLNQHPRALVNRDGVGCLNLLLRFEIDKHTASVVAVNGFDYDWQAQILGGFPGILCVLNSTTLWDRHAAGF